METGLIMTIVTMETVRLTETPPLAYNNTFFLILLFPLIPSPSPSLPHSLPLPSTHSFSHLQYDLGRTCLTNCGGRRTSSSHRQWRGHEKSTRARAPPLSLLSLAHLPAAFKSEPNGEEGLGDGRGSLLEHCRGETRTV